MSLGRWLRLGAWVVLGCSVPAASLAQHYPSHPITMIVPFTAAGPLDITARLLAEKLSASLGQPVIVENRPGASGNIGSGAVAKAAPDGYTLLVALSTTMTVNPLLYKTMPFDSQKDLRPLSILTVNSQMLVVSPSLPVRSAKDFVAYAKTHTLNYAHAGYGSPGHLAMEYFALKAGFKANPVPYRGNAPLVNDLVSGQIPCGFVATAGVIPHVKAGRLRALALSAKTRSALVPDVPTLAESGYPDFNMETYFLLEAPAGLPDSIAARLERAASDGLKAPNVQKVLRAIDLIPVGSTGAQAAARIASDLQLWSGVIKATHMHVE